MSFARILYTLPLSISLFAPALVYAAELQIKVTNHSGGYIVLGEDSNMFNLPFKGLKRLPIKNGQSTMLTLQCDPDDVDSCTAPTSLIFQAQSSSGKNNLMQPNYLVELNFDSGTVYTYKPHENMNISILQEFNSGFFAQTATLTNQKWALDQDKKIELVIRNIQKTIANNAKATAVFNIKNDSKHPIWINGATYDAEKNKDESLVVDNDGYVLPGSSANITGYASPTGDLGGTLTFKSLFRDATQQMVYHIGGVSIAVGERYRKINTGIQSLDCETYCCPMWGEEHPGLNVELQSTDWDGTTNGLVQVIVKDMPNGTSCESLEY